MTRNVCFKIILFAVIFLILFSGISQVMTVPGEYRNYQFLTNVYAEDDNSLDAVYLGSSNCYAFWNSMIAWDKYGIAVSPYACNTQPPIAAEYLIREVRKTQPDALFILNTNAFTESKEAEVRFHYLLDYMPFSFNKLKLTHYLTKTENMSFTESLEFYIPMVRYHNRWSELVPEDFNYALDGFKGASYHYSYLTKHTNISANYITSTESAPMPQVVEDAYQSLLDYCEKEHVKVLFVSVPRAEENETIVQQINSLNAMVTDRGFPLLNLLDHPEIVGVDTTQDYYNNGHTNLHGSIKFTKYLSEYLIEHYGFTDKRENPKYESWNKGAAEYKEKINNYILSIETNAARDFNMKAPKKVSAKETEEGVTVTWSKVEGAQRYMVFRKAGSGNWKKLKSTADLTLVDTAVKKGTKYIYRVVPYYKENGTAIYGNFKYTGVSVTIE